MELINQRSAVAALDELSRTGCHAILIDGASGVGKSYLSRYYADKCGIEAYLNVPAKMDAIRETMDSCYTVENPVLICLENLDSGVVGTSYAILKFLEEPPANVWLVITCKNIRQIPDTILSRTIRISIPPVSEDDILTYLRSADSPLKGQVEEHLLPCLRSFNDVDKILALSADNISYLSNVASLINVKDPISKIVWKLQKFPDGTSTPTDIVVRALMHSRSDFVIPCIQYFHDVEYGKIPDHAALSLLVMDIKYKK